MNNCRLHPLIFDHLRLSDAENTCRDYLLVSFCVKNNDHFVLSGIRQAAVCRLKHPKTHLFIFSFLTIDVLKQKDDYGILSLPGTIFVRLPCDRSYFNELINTFRKDILSISCEQWRSFSENACKLLLKDRIGEIMHGKKHEIGNQVMHPLRAAAIMFLSKPDSPSFKQAYASRLVTYKDYIRKPHISEMIEWALICRNSTDPFIQQTVAMTKQLKKIEAYNHYPTDIKKLISDIDLANKALRTFN